MTIDEVMQYVMHTPENSNPAVLHDMLNQLDSGSVVDDNYIFVIPAAMYFVDQAYELNVDTEDYEEILYELYNNNKNFLLNIEYSNASPNECNVIMKPITDPTYLPEEATIGFSGQLSFKASSKAILLNIYFDDDSGWSASEPVGVI